MGHSPTPLAIKKKPPTYVEVKVQLYRISRETEKSILMKLNLKLVSLPKRNCAKNGLQKSFCPDEVRKNMDQMH
jgi:hypothetical protein